MSVRNTKSVRKEVRGGKPYLVIDFRFVDKSGKQVRYRRDASVQLMTAAVAEAERLKRYAAEHGTLDLREPVPTFGAFVDGVFEREFLSRYRPATAERYRALLRQGMREELGHVPLDEIVPDGARRFANTLRARGVQLKGPLTFLRTVLNAAVEAGVITEVPPFPKLWKEGKKLPDAPSVEEVAQLLAHAKGWLRNAIALAAYAGLRCGEVRALEVRDVNFDKGLIVVRHAFSADVVLAPKSGHERVVPIANELRPILVEATRHSLPRARLVVNGKGKTPSRQNVLSALVRLQEKHDLPRRSFHSLRHFFCSLLIRTGANVEVVRLLAGHSDLATTQRYVHAEARDLAAAIAKLG